MDILPFPNRRTEELTEAKLIHAIPPEADSPLHTLGLLGMREGEVLRWLEKRGISVGYLYTVEGTQVFSYYECDKQGEPHGVI